jgi:hypothetical protein
MNVEPFEVLGAKFMVLLSFTVGVLRQSSSTKVTNSVTEFFSQLYDIGDMTDFEAHVGVFQNITYLCESKLI